MGKLQGRDLLSWLKGEAAEVVKAWEEPGISVHLFIFVVLGLKLCFCINNGIPMKAEPTESPQAPLCPLPTQLDYSCSHCQVGFGLGHCLEGEFRDGNGLWRCK